jgi:hypothetical protein
MLGKSLALLKNTFVFSVIKLHIINPRSFIGKWAKKIKIQKNCEQNINSIIKVQKK